MIFPKIPFRTISLGGIMSDEFDRHHSAPTCSTTRNNGRVLFLCALCLTVFVGCFKSKDAEELYQEGIQFTKDVNYAKAANCFKKAAKQGHALSLVGLGYCYESGKGVKRDYKKAEKCYRQAMKAEEPEGYSSMARFLYDYSLFGKDGREDYATMLEYHKKAAEGFRKKAEDGDALAQCNLGVCYWYGLGVSKDYTKAAKWFKLSAEQKCWHSYQFLGDFYACGAGGLTRDICEAVRWWTAAAENNVLSAQFALIGCYEIGFGVPENKDEAALWSKKYMDNLHHRASQGEAGACGTLARYYSKGFGNYVEKDDSKAKQWWNLYLKKQTEEAEFGSLKAAGDLQYLYSGSYGDLCPKNETLMKKWFKLKKDGYCVLALLGDEAAQYQYSDCLLIQYNETSDEKDREEFFSWLQKAGDNGDLRAQYRLAMVNKKAVSNEETFKAFSQLTKSMDIFAPLELATCYVEGIGCKKNKKQAEYWSSLSFVKNYWQREGAFEIVENVRKEIEKAEKSIFPENESYEPDQWEKFGSYYWSDSNYTNFPLQPLPKPYYSHFSKQQESKYIRICYWSYRNRDFKIEMINTSNMPIYAIAFNLQGKGNWDSKLNHVLVSNPKPWMPGELIKMDGYTNYDGQMYIESREASSSKYACNDAWFENLMIIFADDIYFPMYNCKSISDKSNNPVLYRDIKSGITHQQLREKGKEMGWNGPRDSRSYDGSHILSYHVGDSEIDFYFMRYGDALYKVIVNFNKNHKLQEVVSSVESIYGKLESGKVVHSFSDTGYSRTYFGISVVYEAMMNETNGRVVGILEKNLIPISFVKGSICDDSNHYGRELSTWSDVNFGNHGTTQDRLNSRSLIRDNGPIMTIYDTTLAAANIFWYDYIFQLDLERIRINELLQAEKEAFDKQEVLFGKGKVFEPDHSITYTGLLSLPEASVSSNARLNTIREPMRNSLALFAKYLFFYQQFRTTQEPVAKEKKRLETNYLLNYVEATNAIVTTICENNASLKNDQASYDDYLTLVLDSWARRQGN